MQQIFIILFVIFSSFTISAQNLTLPQILEIKKKNLGRVEEYLTAKGWEFYKAIEPSDGKFGYVTFAFNKSNVSSGAESFLAYYYSSYYFKTRVSIQVNKKNKYSEYINSIKGFGCQLISTKIEQGELVKIYRGATTTFKITSSTSPNFYKEESAIWNILVISNEDYDLNWGNE